MKIVLANAAGFCMGVRMAVDMALKTVADEGRPVYTCGPLIHNPQELERLESEGVISLGESEKIPSGPVVIRAHGVTPGTHERLKREATVVLDATCPKVQKIQNRIKEFSSAGYAVVIAGDEGHPEVVGLLGYASGNAYLISAPEDIDKLPPMEKVILVAQTTQDEENYEAIRKRFLKRFPKGEALSTICKATHRRQEEVRRLAGELEGIVVIGGKNSANTRRLYEIAVEGGIKAWYVEKPEELPLDEIGSLSSVGVTAGASTPLWLIQEVVDVLEKI
ncbi:MAG: 4-hydroxy-3-methylbut-2-enyl diphosphate reductase [Deltaproteobacteria bacterium]|nr:MAG: 4-hydroxy-3-methylbut-2-enyl diphosphate reductase [Deltaproteobacteria bacterium]